MSGDVVKKLSEKIGKDAVQRTKADETKKGYDTDGYGYQYIVDRLNEVCGSEWGFAWKIIKELDGEYRSGAKFHEIAVGVDIWVTDNTNIRSCVGGHISMSYADALKGAITNGFKKTAAFWGVGRDAYAGTIDDDNVPLPDSMENIKGKTDNTQEAKPAEKPQGKKSVTDGMTEEAKKLYSDIVAELMKRINPDMPAKDKTDEFNKLAGSCLKDYHNKQLQYFTLDELKNFHAYLLPVKK